jgi:ABC-type branched-subunit amino acid transport system ATPase component
MGEHLLRAEGIVAGYGGGRVVTGIDLSVAAGEVVALVGRNGAGKSTLVGALSGTNPTLDGTVRIGATDVTRASGSARYRLGMRTVRQDAAVVRGLTVAENLRLVGSDVTAAAAAFPFLERRGGQRAGTLSGGEQKMLAMARQVADPGAVWILDEPTEGLQPMNVERCADIIRTARSAGVGVLLVEQHLTMALAVADRWLVVEQGVVVESGDVDQHAVHRVAKRLAL